VGPISVVARRYEPKDLFMRQLSLQRPVFPKNVKSVAVLSLSEHIRRTVRGARLPRQWANGGQLGEPGAFVKRLNELMLAVAGTRI
jgi:hypothetical protein